MESNQRGLKDALEDASCYLGNLEELTTEANEVLVEDTEGKIVLDFKGGVSLLQIVWDKIKETVSECAGKEIEVKLPDGIAGSLIAAALQLVGFKL